MVAIRSEMVSEWVENVLPRGPFGGIRPVCAGMVDEALPRPLIGGPRGRERALDAGPAASDKAAMKTTAIIGICIIG